MNKLLLKLEKLLEGRKVANPKTAHSITQQVREFHEQDAAIVNEPGVRASHGWLEHEWVLAVELAVTPGRDIRWLA
jgi:hypothetical protein